VEDKEVLRIASLVKDQLVLEGNVYDLRKLSWRSLQKAAEAKQIAQAVHMRSLGGEIFREIAGDRGKEATQNLAEKQKTPEGRAQERYATYDQEEILVAGLERVNGTLASRAFVNEELDSKTAEALHRRIIDLSLGPLDTAGAEEVQGKS
jgi:hypothetical protein